MSSRVIVRSQEDNHILFSVFKAYYPHNINNIQENIDHKHTEVEVSSIINGSGIYCCKNKDYAFHPGDVFFHSGNDAHYFKSIEDGNLALIVVRFDPRFLWAPSGAWSNPELLNLFSGKNITSCRISHDCKAAKDIAILLEDIFLESINMKPAYDLLMKANLMSIFANLARHFHSEFKVPPLSSTNKKKLLAMEKSMDYILNHLSDELSLDLLAEIAGMSPSNYSTTFKKLNGVSPWDYIVGQRISMAQHHLENTGESILKIAELCGFNSIANFNRSFKMHTGKSPREYRKFRAQQEHESEDET